jgi:hypothetical protein
MSGSWWPWHPLAQPYQYSAISGESTCNCTPPAVISVADADAYMAPTLKADAWAALTATQKARALSSAQTALQTLRWCTDATECCGRQLASSYVAAASELALVLYADNAASLSPASQLPAPVTKRQKLGDLEEEFFDPFTTIKVVPKDNRVNGHSPTLLRLYPWLIDLIGCWIDRQTSTIVPMYRG